jgi:hypothetical protein
MKNPGRRPGRTLLIFLLTGLPALFVGLVAGDVTVDFDQDLGPSPAWYGTDSFFTDQDGELLLYRWQESGQKIIRVHLAQEIYEPQNDNEQPWLINWDAFRFGEPFPWFDGRTITLDTWVAALRDGGFTIMPNFVYLAGWLTANEDEGLFSTFPPADLDEYREYVYAVLYHMVHDLDCPPEKIVVEAVNEPDYVCGMDPGVHCFWDDWVMADLVDVVVTTVDAARSVDPGIRVVGLSECCGTSLTRQFMNNFDGADYLDGLTYHTYVNDDFSEAITRGNALKPYGLPVIINEYGSFNHLSDGLDGALWHSYAVDLLWRNGINPMQYPFTEFYGNSEPYNSMGLLLDWQDQWIPKPVYFVYGNLFNHMGETTRIQAGAAEDILVLAGRKSLSGNRDRVSIFLTNISGVSHGPVRFQIDHFPSNQARVRIYDNTAGLYPVSDFVAAASPLAFTSTVGVQAAQTLTVTGPADTTILDSLSTRGEGLKVRISWKTAVEPGLDGFFVLRSSEAGGIYSHINPSLIRRRGSTFYGATYAFLDGKARPGSAYWYKIEARASDGTHQSFGPVRGAPARGVTHELLPAENEGHLNLR